MFRFHIVFPKRIGNGRPRCHTSKKTYHTEKEANQKGFFWASTTYPDEEFNVTVIKAKNGTVSDQQGELF